ncbi:MAG: 2-amino-4-hydroxy-6-hydroxymethyldihydropteridine diphosphokinase [Methylomonas sp.]
MSDHQTPVEAYIGIGSNLDNPVANLHSAYQAISDLDGVTPLALSPLYSSKPVGPQDQPDYVNAVLRINTTLSAQQLLTELQQIETAHGRVRTIRWGARTLDLDILLFGNAIINDANLIVPHVEMANRGFVLYPLADIAPSDLQIPGQNSLAQLLAACPADGLHKITE